MVAITTQSQVFQYQTGGLYMFTDLTQNLNNTTIV